MIAKRSIAVLTNMLEDIKKICFCSLIIVQSIFIIFYFYSIYNNFNNLIFLITYSVLCLLSIITFILFLIKHKQNQKINKNFSRSKNFLKYIVNVIMLIVNIIDMLNFGINDFSKVLLAISGISLFIQITFEFIKIFAEKYIRDFKYAFEKDFEFFNFSKWKSNTIKLINVPFEKLEIRKTGQSKELSKEELILENHLKKFRFIKEQKAIAKIEKKSEAKKQENLRIHKELKELKNHVANVFGKKNNKEQIQETGVK
ncbi:MAG: hypothetical protein IJ301_04625 [Clostridia bacterium]|nr:hypothetical protein [Clostridia bacterium]